MNSRSNTRRNPGGIFGVTPGRASEGIQGEISAGIMQWTLGKKFWISCKEIPGLTLKGFRYTLKEFPEKSVDKF